MILAHARERFERLWNRSHRQLLHSEPCFDMAREILWSRLVTAYYAAPDRHYHTLEHVEEALDNLAFGPVLPTPEEYWAIWFHDIDRDSTEHSAAEARAHLIPIFGSRFAEAVAFLVQVTDHSRPPERFLSDAAKRVHDADLAILAAPEDRFARYEQDIRREWAHVSDEKFRQERHAVLLRFWNRDRLFLTDDWHRVESVAVANLARSIAALAAGKLP